MKPSTKPKADATNPALPSYQQMVALSLTVAERELAGLLEIRTHDEHWDDADIFVDMSVELAHDYVQGMKQRTFEDSLAFIYELNKLEAPLRLAVEQFSRQDCLYARSLSAAADMISKLCELTDMSSMKRAAA